MSDRKIYREFQGKGLNGGGDECPYARARIEGVKSPEEALADRVTLIQEKKEGARTLEQFQMPKGIREWHLDGKLIYAEDWGRGVPQTYYEAAQARGLEVELDLDIG